MSRPRPTGAGNEIGQRRLTGDLIRDEYLLRQSGETLQGPHLPIDVLPEHEDNLPDDLALQALDEVEAAEVLSELLAASKSVFCRVGALLL